MIELKDALRQIDKKDYRDGNGTFDITFMKTDRNKKTGGEFISLKGANSCGLPPTCKNQEMRGIKDNESGKKYAVHNRLIFTFDHHEVFWI